MAAHVHAALMAEYAKDAAEAHAKAIIKISGGTF